MEEKEKQKTVRAARRLIIKLGILAIVFILVWTFIGRIYVTHDQSMYPSLRDGDLVVTSKLSKYLDGEIVLYRVGGTWHLGRIVGVPGDEIYMEEGGFFTVNGNVPMESIYYATSPAEKGSVYYPYTVREGEYFILNDMRENTKDSREYGAIPVKNLYGIVVLSLRHRGF